MTGPHVSLARASGPELLLEVIVGGSVQHCSRFRRWALSTTYCTVCTNDWCGVVSRIEAMLLVCLAAAFLNDTLRSVHGWCGLVAGWSPATPKLFESHVKEGGDERLKVLMDECVG